MTTNYSANFIDVKSKCGVFAELYDNIAKKIEKGVKFNLPDDGFLFDVKYRGSIAETYEPYILELKLPYEIIVLEFKKIINKDGLISQFILVCEQEIDCISFYVMMKDPSLADRWLVLNKDKNFILGDLSSKNCTAKIAELCVPEKHFDFATGIISYAITVLMGFLSALSCKNTILIDGEKPNSKRNEARIKKNKAPLFEYKVLVIDTQKAYLENVNTQGLGGHASPRSHLRRGHIRRLIDKNIWVNACVVGARSQGVIEKEYNVR